ncbi:hypothetical protein [Serratia fonticola]
MKYCLIANGIVVNVVAWDGKTPVNFGRVEVVGVDDDAFVGPGFIYDGENFTAPVQQVE